MNNRSTLIVPFLLLFLAFTSCKKDRLLNFSSESFTENSLADCKKIVCPEITINYIVVTPEDEASEKINNRIQEYIISSLNIGDDSIASAVTISEAAINFIKTYRMHSAEFPDMAADYFAEINVSKTYNSLEFVSLELRHYLYTGGAHGYSQLSFMNLDSETGNVIPNKSLFNDLKEFTVFAEMKFRQNHSISKNESINSTGFWFENDQFYLPESIGFTKDWVLLIYNQYDIASYADGPIELKIPRKEAAPYLKY